MPLVIKPPRRTSTAPRNDTQPAATPLTASRALADRSQSPDPPPASPLTPTIPTGSWFGRHESQVIAGTHGATSPPAPAKAVFIDQPPTLPFSGENATDAIALRAAISSLQYQKQKAERDIRTLQEIKRDAMNRPSEFQDHVVKTALEQERVKQTQDFTFGNLGGDEGEESDGERKGHVASPKTQQTTFQTIPQPQDVVRCPPVNFAKYRVVGQPLDQMHNIETRRGGDQSTPRSESRVAAQYDPMNDSLSKQAEHVGRRDTEHRKGSATSTSPRAAKTSPPAKVAGRK